MKELTTVKDYPKLSSFFIPVITTAFNSRDDTLAFALGNDWSNGLKDYNFY